MMGNQYKTKYLDYVCVDNIGRFITPDRVTKNFAKILKKNNMRKIRFHDLRHTCASLMLANDVPMKQIQEWLGHADFSTTANIYSHLNYASKIDSANTITNIFNFGDDEYGALNQNNDKVATSNIKQEIDYDREELEKEVDELKAKLAKKEQEEEEFIEWKKQKELEKRKLQEDIEM